MAGVTDTCAEDICKRSRWMMITDRYKVFLQMALEEAELALEDNTYPVGAILVDDQLT